VRAVAEVPSPEIDQVRLRALIDEYFAALKVAGRSPRTIEWYRDNLLEFVRFAERDGHPATAGDLQPPVVRRWPLLLQSRPRRLAPSSIAGRVRSLKAFGTWVAAELDLASNPLRAVPLSRVPEQLVPSLRDPEIIALLRAIEGSHDPERDRAIVLLLLDTGVRVSEAASFGLVTWTSSRVGVVCSGRWSGASCSRWPQGSQGPPRVVEPPARCPGRRSAPANRLHSPHSSTISPKRKFPRVRRRSPWSQHPRQRAGQSATSGWVAFPPLLRNPTRSQAWAADVAHTPPGLRSRRQPHGDRN
jgi:hypothetical protein